VLYWFIVLPYVITYIVDSVNKTSHDKGVACASGNGAIRYRWIEP